ncbi:helix-turn-helix domain-containing protein [Streptomyces sp. MNP-20]|uniref:helix-turn-helix domain-containing protein n=1 Tax=Streptomyces sp. MNP-20 TaxID=2721165 RepID=UPI001551A95E|nr:helix-turn-helix domain-containing protein [Streptomyces sp. MNP-20]
MQSYTTGRAVRLPGVCPDTARRWADAGRVAPHRDRSGRRRIEGRDLAAFSTEVARGGIGEEAGVQATARVKSAGVPIDRV